MSEGEAGGALIKAIMAGAVIVVAIALIIIVFAVLLPKFRGEELTDETIQETKDRFDVLIENLEKCQNVEEENCLCDGFQNFPAAFPTNSKLMIEQQGKRLHINWTHGGNVYKKATVENVKLDALLLEEDRKIPGTKKVVEFKTALPRLLQEGFEKGTFRKEYLTLATGSIFKGKDGLYLPVFYSRSSGDDEGELTLAIAKEKIENMKSCLA